MTLVAVVLGLAGLALGMSGAILGGWLGLASACAGFVLVMLAAVSVHDN